MNIENLKKARENVQLTQIQAAEKLGLSDGTYKNYEQGKREPNNDILVSIADLFHVTTDYLLGRETGEPTAMEKLADQFNMTALEREILDGYVNLPKEMRGNLMDFLHDAVKNVMQNSKSEAETTTTQYIELSYISDRVSAGLGENLQDYENKEKRLFVKTRESAKADFVLKIDGRSMEPTFSHDDYILVRSQPAVHIGEIGVFCVDGKGYVKEYGGNRLISHNKEFPDIEVTEDAKCFGLVLGRAEAK